MLTFRQMAGTVYVLENVRAARVKVGMTINAPIARLRAVNDLWLGVQGTCQVCGRRMKLVSAHVPPHAATGRPCAGTGAPPLEQEATVAARHLAGLRVRLDRLTGVERGSVVRMITTLERRIAMPRHVHQAAGWWELHTTVRTLAAEAVERLAHSLLVKHRDGSAPFGEVFRCSPDDATDAIERALTQLGLAEHATRQRHADGPAAPPGG